MNSLSAHDDLPLTGHHVLLSADNLHFLLPQSHVGAVQFVDAANLMPVDEDGLFQLSSDPDQGFFAALSSEMKLLKTVNKERFLTTTLGGEGLKWCWSDVKVLIQTSLVPKKLPQVLTTVHGPFDSYVEIDGRPVFVSSADRVLAFALNTEG